MENELDIPRGIIKQKEIKLKPNERGDIPFHIPEEAKVPGMEYRWIATTLTKYGREVMQENLEEASSRGWLPISRSGNPGLMNETREFYSFDDYVMEQAHLLAGRLVNKKQIEFDNCIIPSLTEESDSLINTLKEIEMRKKHIPRLTAKQVEALSPVNGCVKVSEDGCNIQEYKDGEWVIVKVLQSRIDTTDVTSLSLSDNCGFEKLMLPLDEE